MLQNNANKAKHKFNKGDSANVHNTVVTVARAWAKGCIIGSNSNDNIYFQDYTQVINDK